MRSRSLFGVPGTILSVLGLSVCLWTGTAKGGDPYSAFLEVQLTNGQRRLLWSLHPGAESYRLLSRPSFSQPWAPETGGQMQLNRWTGPFNGNNSFHQLEVSTISSNRLLTAIILNRMAYGPTPDELERILTGSNAIGPQAWIDEQLAPELIVDTEMEQSLDYLTLVYNVETRAADDEPLRALHSIRAVRSKRQLMEVLLMFFDTHFNTQHDKTKNYLDGRDANYRQSATDLEYRELTRWRNLLMNPNATFEDMLKVSAESPAMVIYLDTVLNRKNVPNENYAREILELFCMGVDNGYTQQDIEEMSKCWTGWRVARKRITDINNPHATPLADNDGTGVWALHFVPNDHHTGEKVLFPNRRVDARFGPVYQTRLYGNNTQAGIYELRLPARSGTSGMQDGYDVIAHLANLPYTQEFISVKLCQWFVHEHFDFGYNYTASNLSAEARLVRDCMAAWEQPGPDGRRGNLRSVLRVIFNSDLFRTQAGAQHKIKTPFEFCASSVRALRARKSDGGYTADTDGYDFKSPMIAMGGMKLFDREEPDGWPETGIGWLNTANLSERFRFVHHLLLPATHASKDDYPGDGDETRQNITLPVDLLKMKVPSSDWNNAEAVVDYFLSILFPGEGAANLSGERQAAINFLNSNSSGTLNNSLFATLAHTSTVYDDRVRGMVAFLMTLPRFQEQ